MLTHKKLSKKPKQFLSFTGVTLQQFLDYQKEWNKLQSKIRIKVEHAISKIKKFRINSDTFRNRLYRYDVISDIVCGIINFKIRWKQEFVVIP